MTKRPHLKHPLHLNQVLQVHLVLRHGDRIAVAALCNAVGTSYSATPHSWRRLAGGGGAAATRLCQTLARPDKRNWPSQCGPGGACGLAGPACGGRESGRPALAVLRALGHSRDAGVYLNRLGIARRDEGGLQMLFNPSASSTFFFLVCGLASPAAAPADRTATSGPHITRTRRTYRRLAQLAAPPSLLQQPLTPDRCTSGGA